MGYNPAGRDILEVWKLGKLSAGKGIQKEKLSLATMMSFNSKDL
jgi:hypothetical protein